MLSVDRSLDSSSVDGEKEEEEEAKILAEVEEEAKILAEAEEEGKILAE